MANPLVSVIMPVYNAEAYIADAINSILAQTLTDFEFIIINDASTDNSRDIIQSFSDKRIRYFENARNEGYIYSLNNALQVAKGDFIARMDADDISLPDRLLQQHSFLKQEKDIDLVGAAIKIMQEGVSAPKREERWDYPESPGGVKARLLFNTAHAHPVVFFRRSLIDRRLYQYDSGYYPAEDYQLWLQLNKYTNTANLAETLLLYRISAMQTSTIAHEKQKHKAALLRSQYFQSLLPERFKDSERMAYQFWYTGFKINSEVALQLFKGYEWIYDNTGDESFKDELALQINGLMSRVYQIHPQLISTYKDSSFNGNRPLSMLNKTKFFLFAMWQRYKTWKV